MNNFSYTFSSPESAVPMFGFTKPVPVEMIQVKETNLGEVWSWVIAHGGIFNSHFMGCLVSWEAGNGEWRSVVVKRDWILVHESTVTGQFVTMPWDEVDSLYDPA